MPKYLIERELPGAGQMCIRDSCCACAATAT